VKTGIQDNNYIEIKSGVNVNDRVISAPFSAISKKLSDSTLVEILKKKNSLRRNSIRNLSKNDNLY